MQVTIDIEHEVHQEGGLEAEVEEEGSSCAGMLHAGRAPRLSFVAVMKDGQDVRD